MKECVKLGIAGIIAEFNPFHNGHKYLIDCAKNDGNTVCCVISSSFVQRGEPAIISKFERAKAALFNGADVVCELQTPWAMSTAQNFAFGAVSQLNALGIDTLYFGSECGKTDMLIKISEIIGSEKYNRIIKEKLSSGKAFAVIREEAVEEIDSQLKGILKGANDTLAVEYIIAAKSINSRINFKAVKRIGPNHNDDNFDGNYSNATLIREALKKGRFAELEHFTPSSSLEILSENEYADISYIEKAILSKLRSMSINEISKLPDISEGIENRIYSAVREACSLEELYERVKTKRYSHARIRRIILNGFLGIDNTFFKTEPPYVRVLGFKEDAFKSILPINSKPIITKVSQINDLDDLSRNVFAIECNVSDQYALAFKNIKKCGADLSTPIIKL